MKKRATVLQHVPFEGPGAIANWAEKHDLTLRTTHLYRGESLPPVGEIAFLVVMGGPMSVNDEAEHPWLAEEKRFIAQVIESGVPVVGICLGAQLIAAAMGCPVYDAVEKEIGWFPVERVAGGSPFLADLPPTFTPLHWHGQTFDLPARADLLASTASSPNQAFAIGRKVLGLQFHLEATTESVAALAENCADEIGEGPFQQPAESIIADTIERSTATHAILFSLLDRLVASAL